MKYAVIDIGTNTVLLLIMEEREGLHDVLDLSTIVKLGEGLAISGRLSGPAMSRTMNAIKHYIGITMSHCVDKLFCVGTAALREASNSREFLEDIKNAFGFDVEIISPGREAFYTYLSVRDDDRLTDGASMVIVDIGGGSTEIICGSRKEFTRYVSLPVGSVKLTDMFIRHDPPSRKELDMAASRVRDGLSGTSYRNFGVLIGTGGTVTNIASIIAGIDEYDKEKIHGFSVGIGQLEMLMAKLAALNSSDRRSVTGMEAGREGIILQGALILREIMVYGGFTNCLVSTKGVRYGVICERHGQTLKPFQ